jgi:phosphoglycerate dehydrogenase-like enzyme
MRVWGVTRSGQADTTYAERIVPVSALHQVLPYADFVVIVASETSETRHLVGAAELAWMKASTG